MSSFHRFGLLIALAGCIDQTPAVDPAARVVIPAVEDYVAGRVAPTTLFPVGVEHVHLAFTPGQVGTSYRWGIAGDRILWIYRVAAADDDEFDADFHGAWEDAEQRDARVSFGTAGSIKGEIPKPPTPPGQPEFSLAYAERVVAAAQLHTTETVEMLAELEALP